MSLRLSVAGCVAMLLAGCASAPDVPTPPNRVGVAPDTKTAMPGLSAAFEKEVARIGQISPDDFARRFPPQAKTSNGLGWDPTTAKYWERIALDPNAPGAEVLAHVWGGGDPKKPAPKRSAQGMFDFRPNEAEFALLKKNGFVVSERLGSHSFTDLYHRVWMRDLPVFITADSLLHAWHRSFDNLLDSVEDHYLHPTLRQLVAALDAELPKAKAAYGTGPLADGIRDADFFLAVARELLEPGAGKSHLGQDERVKKAVDACHRQEMETFVLFGVERDIDFSQFKPRGRYDRNEGLKRYFRAMMWLGRIDFRLAGGGREEQDLRELAGAVVLHDLLVRAGMRDTWLQFDRVVQMFAGRADCLTMPQFDVLLTSFETSAATLTREGLPLLRNKIASTDLGEQHIRGEVFFLDPTDPNKFVLPRTFAFFGQRFTVDSWALTKIVFDDVIWDNKKVRRQVPSAADVAFAVFGNDAVVPLLQRRMNDKTSHRLRDGLNYQHNLAAVRNLIDRMPDGIWQESAAAEWVGCLRELSRPNVDPKYPQAVRTEAWAEKTVTCQLASWTQLKHDTVLYAKPAYSGGAVCSYPAGYVEPVPHFWARFGQMAKRTRERLTTALEGVKPPPVIHGGNDPKQWLKHLAKFEKVAGTLQAIAEKELARKELSEDEVKFLKTTVVPVFNCVPEPLDGWYPDLHRVQLGRGSIASDEAHKWVALVADVHTDPPNTDILDPGCVLHNGVGNVDLLLIGIDDGKDRIVYAGPVFSHYEFETPNAVRRTDGDWKKMLREGQTPPRPEWSRTYLAPGRNEEAKNYGKAEDAEQNPEKTRRE
jgi:hypothetical protein